MQWRKQAQMFHYMLSRGSESLIQALRFSRRIPQHQALLVGG